MKFMHCSFKPSRQTHEIFVDHYEPQSEIFQGHFSIFEGEKFLINSIYITNYDNRDATQQNKNKTK